jgi:hypothetical protein
VTSSSLSSETDVDAVTEPHDGAGNVSPPFGPAAVHGGVQHTLGRTR